MAKIKNKRIHSEDRAYLQRLADELEFIGRPYSLDLEQGILIQFALPPKRKSKRKDEKRRDARNKRAESAARRS